MRKRLPAALGAALLTSLVVGSVASAGGPGAVASAIIQMFGGPVSAQTATTNQALIKQSDGSWAGGTISGTLFSNQTANTVFSGPSSGGAAAPTFRALVEADIPNLNASKITAGTLATARGGTGVDGSAAANGRLLIGNGSGYTLANLTAGTNITITNGAGTIQIDAAAGATETLAQTLTAGNTTGSTNIVVENSQAIRGTDTSAADAADWTVRGGDTSGLTFAGGDLTVRAGNGGSSAHLRLEGGDIIAGGINPGGQVIVTTGDSDGTDKVAGTLTLATGSSTGSATGTIDFKVPAGAGTGSTARTAATVLSIANSPGGALITITGGTTTSTSGPLKLLSGTATWNYNTAFNLIDFDISTTLNDANSTFLRFREDSANRFLATIGGGLSIGAPAVNPAGGGQLKYGNSSFALGWPGSCHLEGPDGQNFFIGSGTGTTRHVYLKATGYVMVTAHATVDGGQFISGNVTVNSSDTATEPTDNSLAVLSRVGFLSGSSGSIDTAFVRLAAGEIKATDGSTGHASLHYKDRVQAKTSNYTATINESGSTVFTNEGAVGAVNFTLPNISTVSGYQFTFAVQAAQSFTVTPSAGDSIRIGSSSSTTSISTSTIGSTVTLVNINGTEWIAVASTGTWTTN